MTRVCSKCHTEKDLELFSRSKAASDGYHTWCKACKAADTRRWLSENRERESAKDRAQYAADGARAREQAKRWHRENRPRSLKSKRTWKLRQYGITPEVYAALLEAQGGKCAICRREPEAGRDLAVDHCHDTRVVRGLLCHLCNVGLGQFCDSPDLLRAAIEYLATTAARKTA